MIKLSGDSSIIMQENLPQTNDWTVGQTIDYLREN